MVNYDRYKEKLEELRDFGRRNGLNDSEINKILVEGIEELGEPFYSKVQHFLSKLLLKMLKAVIFISLVVITIKVALYWYPSVYHLLMRNLQVLIYPGFKIIRKLAIPVLKLYPELTELYDESCLVENPWFQLSEMDCWPCSILQSVPDLSGRNISRNFNTGIPFTRFEFEDSREVSFSTFISTLKSNRSVFLEDSPKVQSNKNNIKTVDDLMDSSPSQDEDTHILWRINRMKPARIIRQLFPRPTGTPDWWGQSVERFLMVDEAKAPAYHLPKPECNHIILRSAAGSRLIRLNPSPECHQSCKSSTVLLSAGQTLWYNWWYWRPVSLPKINETDISIQYFTSFCS